MIPNGIEDKYEIVQILQETAATAVLLVNYKQIGALRILKAIHRASPDAHSILSESHLLQGINSSQIPTIFSVEETNEMYYLVEEFVEGISLREYLFDLIISKEELLTIAISLCNVVEALHTADPEPVLYRDMKPEHIILQGDTVRLIDFGIAVKKSEAAKAKPLGTKNWAAPEQLLGQPLDQRCDIYSVGKIIEFMQINSYAKDDIKLRKLVEHATNPDVEKRIASISTLKNKLLALQGVGVHENYGKGNLDKTIAVIGADHGVGTSHIAINLCRYLNKLRLKTYYKDVEGNTVHNLWQNLKGSRVKEGVLYHDNFCGIVNYGDAVEHYTPPTGLYVYDCGINEDHLEDVDIIFFVTTTSPWKKPKYPSWIQDKSVYVISNFSNKLSSVGLAHELKKKVYMYPCNNWSLKLTKEEEKFFSTVLKYEKDFNT